MRWQHIQFSDGSNPFICTTERKLREMQNKYGDNMIKIKEGFWYVKIPISRR